MKRWIILLGSMVMAALVGSVPAVGQEVEYEAIEEKNLLSGKDTIDPGKGYIFLHAQARANGMFIKAPDADDLAVYGADWEEAFAKASDRYRRDLERWSDRQAAGLEVDDEPVEPTRETFSIEEIERRLLVSFGPQYVFSKDTKSDERSFSYMIEVEPGTYTYYGPLIFNGQAFGACYCMGTVKFDVPAGQITSLGDFLTERWASAEDFAQATVFEVDRPEPAQPVEYLNPASLSDHNVVPAELHAAGKINNFFGVAIARLPPIEGVLAYERDTVIDVRYRDTQAVLEREQAEEAARLAEMEAATDEVMAPIDTQAVDAAGQAPLAEPEVAPTP